MILDDIEEISLLGVANAGIPNKECVVLKANTRVAVGQYALLVGVRTEMGMAIPLPNHFLWMGDVVLKEGDWIFVFTCKGQVRSTRGEVGNTIYSAYWGLEQVVFTDVKIVPMLARLEGLAISGDRL